MLRDLTKSEDSHQWNPDEKGAPFRCFIHWCNLLQKPPKGAWILH